MWIQSLQRFISLLNLGLVCRLNEEMIETLFMVNSSKLGAKDIPRAVPTSLNPENRVLDPKKSQNIAILLRALNVTIEEVCEALLEGKCASSLGLYVPACFFFSLGKYLCRFCSNNVCFCKSYNR